MSSAQPLKGKNKCIVEAKALWREYGNDVILEHVNARVKEGEFITIVGASGCGKTTFLKMLLGMDSPTRGALLMDGKAIKDEPNHERGIVFQRYSVFPHLSVLENVMAGLEFQESKFFARCFGRKRRALEEKASAILEKVGLQNALSKYPFELSGGMQQRLSMAQSIIKKPRILLLDEPFGALDPGIRKDMYALTLSLWREYGITIFMVTHDLREGFYLGTRLWVFDKPRIDPHEPNRFGAQITYDIPVGQCQDDIVKDIVNSNHMMATEVSPLGLKR